MSEDETGALDSHPSTILCWLCDFQHVTDMGTGCVQAGEYICWFMN